MKKKLITIIGLGILFHAFAPHAEEVGYNPKYYERFSPEEIGQGVRAGSFIITPQATVEESYNDNIYSQETNEVEDMITVVKPSISAKSDWANHAASVTLINETAMYMDNDSENYTDYSAAAKGRLDVRRNIHLDGSADYYKNHEDRASPDNNNGVEPNKFNEFVGRTAISTDQTRISTTIGMEIRDLDYENNVTGGGTIIDNEQRNRQQYGADIRVSYQMAPGYKTFVKGALNKIEYDSTTIANNRNSDGYNVGIGAEVDLTGKLRGEIYTGYLEQTYDDSSFDPIKGIDFGGSLLWQATNLTSLKLEALRSVNETVLNGSSGFLQSYIGVSAEHELRRNIILEAKSDFRNNDYEGIEREDNVLTLSGNAKYFIGKSIAVKTGYTYTSRSSNVAGSDYDDNRVTIGLSLAI